MTVARVGIEKARIGIAVLFPEMLWMVAEADPAAAHARELEALNGAATDFDDRLQKLEVSA